MWKMYKFGNNTEKTGKINVAIFTTNWPKKIIVNVQKLQKMIYYEKIINKVLTNKIRNGII